MHTDLTFEFVYVAFWVYVGFALCVCIPMLMVWFNEPHDIKTFTPAWAFLVFPCMLVGTSDHDPLHQYSQAS